MKKSFRRSSRVSKHNSVSSDTETVKFDDFIFIAEFSEQIGPTPVLCIPDCCPESFNKIAFAVRVLSVDWHIKVSNNSGEALSRFSLDQDVQMLLSEPKEDAEAIVSYMTVYDLHARGNERPYCICYISQDKNKMMLFFEDIVKAISKIVMHIHRRNYEVFLKDLKVHSNLLRKDLKVIKDEGLPNSLPPGVTPESAVTDITLHLQDMSTIMGDLDEMLCDLNNHAMTSSTHSFARSHSDTLRKKTRGFMKRTNSDFKYSQSISPSALLATSPNYTLSTITSSVRNFDRKLRCLPELVSAEMWGEIRKSLEEVVHLYRQDTSLLLLNRYDNTCLKPRQSLLSIGQFAVNNFIPQDKPVYQSTQSNVKPSEVAEDLSQVNPEHYSKVWSVKNSGFKNGSFLFPDKKEGIQPLRRDSSISSKSFSSLESTESQSILQPSSTSTSSSSRMLESVETKLHDQVLSANPLGYNVMVDIATREHSSYVVSQEDPDSMEGSNDYLTPPDIELSNNFDNPPFLPNSPVLFANTKPKSNLHTSSDLLAQLHRTPNLINIAYSMLSGKPVMCECENMSEEEIEKLSRNLSLFLPGSANRNKILPKSDQTSIQLSNLHNIKLAMVHSKSMQKYRPYNQVKRHSQVLTIKEGKSTFYGHGYEGSFLSMLSKSYLTRQRSVPISEAFVLSLLQSVLHNLAMKSYLLFYHSLSGSQSAIKSGDVLKNTLSLSNADWEIMKYFTKIIREQLIEHEEKNKCVRVLECVPCTNRRNEVPMLTLLGYVDCQNEEMALTFTSSSDTSK